MFALDSVMGNFFYKFYLLYKWKKCRRRGECLRVNVSNVVHFLQELESIGIPSLVLRWPEDVPTSRNLEVQYLEDVDLLIDINPESFYDLASLVSRYRGSVPCDLYGVNGCKGTRYLNMPYYPPVLAEEIMENRELYASGFYVPDLPRRFYSFAYHLVYHKGERSGLPFGVVGEGNEAGTGGKHVASVEVLGGELGVAISRPYTLLALHEYLKSVNWSMPYDLLERWPEKSAWHKRLIEHEKGQLAYWAEKMPGLLIFFVRECAMHADALQVIQAQLSQQFQVLHEVQLDNEQIDRVVRLVRGGDWYREDIRLISGPRRAIICYDHQPEFPVSSCPIVKGKASVSRNSNLDVKKAIREKLKNLRKMGSNGIHSSDDGYESQHMLSAIFAEDRVALNQHFLNKINMVRS